MMGLEFDGVVKNYQGLRPLRISNLAIALEERASLAGLDVPAAEVFINLATGAGLPDQGEVRVLGQPTSAITEGDMWLASLDTFGIVSHRAVLLDGMTIAENIAMSFSLSIDPIPPDIRTKVDALAAAVGIANDALDKAAAAASGATKVRVHLARALALDPPVLVLEHPTLNVAPGDVPALAASIANATAGRTIAVLAISDDTELAKGLGGRRLQVKLATGALTDLNRSWWR